MKGNSEQAKPFIALSRPSPSFRYRYRKAESEANKKPRHKQIYQGKFAACLRSIPMLDYQRSRKPDRDG